MLLTDVNSHYRVNESGQLSQGDIFRGLEFRYVSIEDDATSGYAFPFPYAVILSQACDLQQHYKNTEQNNTKRDSDQKHDKILNTILVCPAFPHENFLTGKHIDDRTMYDFDGPKGQEKAYNKLKKNDVYSRYHYLSKIDDIFPELIIDFKNFHTVPIEIVQGKYQDCYLASLKQLYRERLSQRFTDYLSRIGLPDEV